METRPTTRRRAISVVFLLILSLLAIASPASAVPLSTSAFNSCFDLTQFPPAGSLKSIDVAPRVLLDLSAQPGVADDYGGGRRRMLRVVTDDYGGTGANSKHDPSTGSR